MAERQPWRPWEIIILYIVGLLALGWFAIVIGLVIRGKPPSDIAIGALVAIPASICGVMLKLVRHDEKP